MTDLDPRESPARLLGRLNGLLPRAELALQSPPRTPELRLWLFKELHPDVPLDASVINALMEEQPYWTLCWASGQVLARYLLDHPQAVRGRSVVDVGAGSGVVALAAALAGASRVIACDLDPWSAAATRENARANGLEVAVSDDLSACLAGADRITAADILYDRENLSLLPELADAAPVMLADSRIPDLDPPGYELIGVDEATTWPDLDEAGEFNRVRLFAAGGIWPKPVADSVVQEPVTQDQTVED